VAAVGQVEGCILTIEVSFVFSTFKGPLGSFEWLGKLDPTLSLVCVKAGNGTAKWRGVERKPKQIGMICGGSGEFH